MRASPARIHTAAELQVALAVRDIQQVRTALARLVDKGLVRRMGVKGEFTI
jgi:diketogulonate reductase-like aldo/keto reductase